MYLLSGKEYCFFVKHLDAIALALIPKRNSDQALHISSLHQRAWLLKLLAVGLHGADISSVKHRETCQSVLTRHFGLHDAETSKDLAITRSHNSTENATLRVANRTKY